MLIIETVTLIIMLSLFYTIVALENHDFELVKLVKRQNEDITLHCSLSENHEVSNSLRLTYEIKLCPNSACFMTS